MTSKWSPHAKSLLLDILTQISFALYIEDAYRWREKIIGQVEQLSDFPYLGPVIPTECFSTIPANADRLRQIVCKPYRVVYEIADGEIHVLSIRHTRMLVTESDTFWN